MDGRRSPARLLAPIALITFVFALLIVVAGSDTDEDSSSNGGNRASQQQGGVETTPEETTTTGGVEPRVSGTFYTVKTGDTLGGIAETVGIPITRLQELNPDLDPQALVSGQKIRLRE
jgi:LysM repeat protein